MDFKLTYRRFSERSIIVEWPSEIEEIILKDVLLFKNHLLNSDIKEILQINYAYNSILIIYNCTIDNINNEFQDLKHLYFNRKIVKKMTNKVFKIPVCYDKKFGIDLDEISNVIKLTKSEIVKLHSSTIYTVYFIGFLPGFLYLGGLKRDLHVPRKKSPRSAIKKGSVAIGGGQTGIYPNVSPAGWHVIGNSPLEFFIPNAKRPCFAKAGDQIQFTRVSFKMHQEIVKQVENGTYQIESEVVDG